MSLLYRWFKEIIFRKQLKFPKLNFPHSRYTVPLIGFCNIWRWFKRVGTLELVFSPEESVPKGSISNNSLDFVTDVAIKTGRENLYIIYTLELYKEEKI